MPLAADQEISVCVAKPDPNAAVPPLQLSYLPVLRRPVESAQYTSVAFGKRCGEAGLRPLMGSVGDAYDNAMAESFFSTLEAELLSRRRFASQAEARMACFSYIEGWYNPVRLHSALGYRSPMAYEAAMQEARADTWSPSPQTVHEIRATSADALQGGLSERARAKRQLFRRTTLRFRASRRHRARFCRHGDGRPLRAPTVLWR